MILRELAVTERPRFSSVRSNRLLN